MSLASRLIIFLCVILTCYTAEKYQQTTIPAKGASPIARVLYSGCLNYVAFLLSGALFFSAYQGLQLAGQDEIFSYLLAGGTSLLFSGLSLFAPKQKELLTLELKKMMVSVVFLMSLVIFPAFISSDFSAFALRVVVSGGMYFIFSLAYSGVLDRMSMAEIPDFLKGLPIALTTMCLFYLSFSFFNGVFFGTL